VRRCVEAVDRVQIEVKPTVIHEAKQRLSGRQALIASFKLSLRTCDSEPPNERGISLSCPGSDPHALQCAREL
jgi:hypothetical protein